MIDLNNIAAEAATTIVAAGALVWRVYRKLEPRIKAAAKAIHWVEQHLQANASAQQALAEVQTAATVDDAAYRETLLKSAVQDFLAAGRFEIATLTEAEIRVAVLFVSSKVPEPFRSMVTPELVTGLLNNIAATATQDSTHQAVQAALVLQQAPQQATPQPTTQQPKEGDVA